MQHRAAPDQGVGRVVDLSNHPSGGYATRLLATHGWEVIKVEPPGGGGYRLLGPFANDELDPDAGAVSAYLDCSKKSVVLDLGLGSDRETLEALLGGADAVVTTDAPSAGGAFAPHAIADRHDGLVVTSITPFGLDGPYAEVASSPIVLEAMSGWLYQTGERGGEPVRIRGELPGALIPGLYAAIGTLAAARWRRSSGGGQVVEISAFEAMVAANRYFETHYAQFGEHIGRCGAMLFPYYGYARTTDGWTSPCAVTERHVGLVARMMGHDTIPDADELEAWFAEERRAELFHEGQAHGIPWGYLATAGEVLQHEQLQARDSFVTIDHPVLGTVEVPGTASHQRTSGGGVERPPLLGEHTGELPRLVTRSRTRVEPPVSPEPRLPLEGVRVLDITSWWAGPMACMILADLGAEVIKIESIQKMDAWRTTLSDVSSPISWETSPLYNAAGRNKLGVTLDLTDPRGAELLCALVAESDVVVENLQPKVLPSLGLSYDTLARHNPSLVMVSQSGFGQTGPWRDYGSLAQVGESLAGIGFITGHPGDRPMLAGHFIGDTLSATHAAVATLAALDERDLTGRGQHVDLSQLESALPAVAEALIDFQVNGRTWGRIGNSSPTMAPHGCYPTLVDDCWVVLAVADDREWATLVDEIDEPWARDPRFETVGRRLEAAGELEAELLAWFVPQKRDDVVTRLRARGLRVGPANSPVDVLADRHLDERGFFQLIDREVVGTLPYPSLGIGFSATPASNRLPAPLLGEHNRQVLEGVLGLDGPALDRLEADGVIGTAPIAPPATITLD